MDRSVDKNTLKKLLKVSSMYFKSVYIYVNPINDTMDFRSKEQSNANDNFA